MQFYQKDADYDEEVAVASKKANFALLTLAVVVVSATIVVLTIIFLSPVIIMRKKPIVKDQTQNTVIMISVDGFRWDYIDQFSDACPNIRNRLLKGVNTINRAGVRAQKLIPIFPTKTFPNHFTLVTGLYAETHGIVANTIYDTESKTLFTMNTLDPQWWQGGEPIWVTCEKQNVTTAAYFWPGANVKIRGYTPTYFEKVYDGKTPYSVRINALLSYLDLKEKRPRLLLSYLEGVDTAGHQFGVDMKKISESIREVDTVIGLLIDGLESRGLMNTTNIIIVSDHGMTNVSPTSKVVYIDDIYPDITVNATSYNYGTFMDVFPKDPTQVEVIKQAIINARTPEYDHFDVYTKDTIPERYHYRNNRLIAPILISARQGWLVTIRSKPGVFQGDHGYDNSFEDMGATFIANGPDFRSDGSTQPSFTNVNVYSILAKVLNITESPTDGSWKNIKELLRK
jgi:predicted AlkP superfamily pyrophosphatase or phosphodiesterase